MPMVAQEVRKLAPQPSRREVGQTPDTIQWLISRPCGNHAMHGGHNRAIALQGQTGLDAGARASRVDSDRLRTIDLRRVKPGDPLPHASLSFAADRLNCRTP